MTFGVRRQRAEPVGGQAGPAARPQLVVAMSPSPSPKGNPFIRQMAEQLERSGCRLAPFSLTAARRADVLHIHWPDHFVSRAGAWSGFRGAAKVVLCCLIARARRRVVVWTVHNLAPHDPQHPWLERAFWPVFTTLLSGCVCLTAAGRDATRDRLPRLRRKRIAVINHGSYAGVYPEFDGDPQEARTRLGLPRDATPLLFFGQVRPYKNVPALLAAFGGVDDPGARLIIAGDGPDLELMTALRQAAERDDRITVTGRVADTEVQQVFAASVGAVLPFREVFNSGSVFLALSLGRPVLVPRTAVFTETREQVGAAWLTFFDPPLRPATLAAFTEHARTLVASGARPDLSANQWDVLGAQIVGLYRELLPQDAGGEP